eukprot:TRINITY_DN13989_c0_g1_i1.p1 TRINITY_DN13989_c0_g1~~TRINITY_DN13989_c0_g1_i1.p1  ORF type:complete len:333 (-),score=35.98 TRINITY_DN13989_c0_g1_i1:249-1247(-)
MYLVGLVGMEKQQEMKGSIGSLRSLYFSIIMDNKDDKGADHGVTFGSENPTTWGQPEHPVQEQHTHEDVEDGYVPPAVSAPAPAPEQKDHVTLDFTESQPAPGKVEGKMQSSEQQQILEGQQTSGGDQEPKKQIGCLTWCSQFFDVDTNDVLYRALHSLYGPLKPDFYDNTKEKPDLYGPFWITTTVIFLTAVASSISLALQNKDDQTKDELHSLFVAIGLYYGYVFVVGAVFWGILKLYGSNEASLTNVWCMYGYTMTIWIPVSVIASVPIAALYWTVIIVAMVWSGLFLTVNFRSIISTTFPVNSVWAMLIQGGVHALVGFIAGFFIFKG